MKPTITVFTPTYNRAYCLHNGYEALCRQTLKDFIWLVVDDGSTDNTKELVEEWQKKDNGFEIRYLYKGNGGLATGYNAAIAVMDTELSVCVDSDDYLADDAIEKVVKYWQANGSEKVAGIVGLDCTPDGEVIGDLLPNQKTINLIDLMVSKYPITNGDRKNIVRTDLYKSVAPMKEFPDERDFNPHYLHIKISKQYDFLVLNEKLCYVDYQTDGMTNTVFKQYLRSPKSFREQRLLDMSLKGVPFIFTAKKTIHYVSSCILSKQPCISASPRKLLTVLMYPFGVALTIYLKHTQREHI
jgi:glycosyltransferase involved in cell wall biosynthesis